MLERVRNGLDDANSSLWFIPSILSLIAIVLSVVLVSIDERVSSDFGTNREWIFNGTPDAARTILSVIAGTLITVISIVFSITILTLQQASRQFTPRIFRHFTSDKGAQYVLGFYIATFIYALLVLRQIRSQDASNGLFVPIISVTVAILLAIVAMALLVYYIHHASALLQASTVVERTHHELINAIDKLYPTKVGEPVDAEDDDDAVIRRTWQMGSGTIIQSTSSGYLQRINDAAILDALPDHASAIIYPEIGEYLAARTPLIEIGGITEDVAIKAGQIRGAFIMGKERTLVEDELFGVRQLVDIALKALSPSINDPTTAEHVISCLGDVLTRLADREFPSRIRVRHHGDNDKQVLLWMPRPDYNDFVENAFDQIRRTAATDVAVTRHLLEVLGEVGRTVHGERAASIRRQIQRIVRQIEQGTFESDDREMLLRTAREAEAATRARPVQVVSRGDVTVLTIDSFSDSL